MMAIMHVTVFPLNLLTSQMDSPSEKTSEIKPTGNGDAKVLNDNMDDSLQGRRVIPDCDEMVNQNIYYIYGFPG